MSHFELNTILICLAALCSYVNYRFVRMQMTIGVMVLALVVSLLMLILGEAGMPAIKSYAAKLLEGIDFNRLLLHGILSFLLFAGAMHVKLLHLRSEKVAVTLLATVGVLISTFLVGSLTFLIFKTQLGSSVPFIQCLLFGALISPTDPIAVLSVMQRVGAPKSLETQVSGESLFNDGIGVVVFMVILELAGGHDMTAGRVVWLLFYEAIGGIGFGMIVGMIVYQMLKRVDDYQVEVLLTLALAMGGYVLADRLQLSAPIAIVVAGMLIGNLGPSAMSPKTEQHVHTFWELIDGVMNAVLFVLIGLQLLVIPLEWRYLWSALIVLPIVLLARFASVAAVVMMMRRRRRFENGAIAILTWGGLRGGISVALALSLSPGPHRNAILAVTYAVVIFSILVQGLTVEKLVRKYGTRTAPA